MPLRRRSLAVAVPLAATLAGCTEDLLLDGDTPVITLSPASITAIPGDTIRVRVTATGGHDATALVLAAPSGVARVDTGGVVTAVSPGSGVVTASFELDGRRVTGTIPITVLGLTLEAAQAVIAVGATAAMRLTHVGSLASYGGFRLTSSDTTVLAVDPNGTVRGVRPGVARVAATAATNPRARAEATFTVVAPQPTIVFFAVAPGTVTLAPGASQQLTASVGLAPGTPETVSREVRYASSDSTVAMVTPSGLVVARRAGTATITASPAAAPSLWQTVAITVRDPAVGRAGGATR